MIMEGLSSLAFWFIGLLFEGMQVVSLPVNLMSVLLDFMKGGAWVLGVDLLVLAFTSVLFWLSFKFTAGLLLFVWRLIPFT